MKVSNTISKVAKSRRNKATFISISEHNFCFLRSFSTKCCRSVSCRNSCRSRVAHPSANGLIPKGQYRNKPQLSQLTQNPHLRIAKTHLSEKQNKKQNKTKPKTIAVRMFKTIKDQPYTDPKQIFPNKFAFFRVGDQHAVLQKHARIGEIRQQLWQQELWDRVSTAFLVFTTWKLPFAYRK